MFINFYVIIIGESCTEGFMDYDLLVQKAVQIGDGRGSLDRNRIGDDIDSIMPSLEFTCSGTIAGFLLGVDVRTETGRRMEYPTIWLWNKTGEKTYTRFDDSSVEIRLGPSNFSTNGFFQFSLSTPLQFTTNQVLGIYQPNNEDSVVRFYYQDYNGQNIYETSDDVNMYSLSNPIRMDRRPLIHPESSMLYIFMIFNLSLQYHAFRFSSVYQWIHIFRSKFIKIQAREITRLSENGNTERFFPDIGFTCNGNITHIIIGAENNARMELPQIRFWRLSDEGEYEQTGSSYSLVYSDANYPSTTNLRWYNLSQPIQVENGDVLGIYQPMEMRSDMVLYFQQVSGPPNYESNGNINRRQNRYPLVSVILGKCLVIYMFYTITIYNVLYLYIRNNQGIGIEILELE